jgi:hypothetical protein
MVYNMTGAPSIIKEAKNRKPRILDAAYTKVEVDPYVQELHHLSQNEKKKLAQTLKPFHLLCGGGLGVFNTHILRTK